MATEAGIGERAKRYLAAISEDAERPQAERRGIIPGVMEVADAEQAELRAEIERLKEEGRQLLRQRQELAEERFAWQQRGDRAEIGVYRQVAARLTEKAEALQEGLHDLAIFVAKARTEEAEILDREAAELRDLASRREEGLDNSVPNPALLDVLAEALMRWNEQGASQAYAALRRPETVRKNAYGRAEAVLAALLEHLDVGEAEAWCKLCRRTWEGPSHVCESDAEQRLARAREVHRQLCPLATGTLTRDAFTCGLCEALDAEGVGR